MDLPTNAYKQASLSSSSKTDLERPNPPASLSLNQQHEYIQLKRKLALHAFKKKMKDSKSLSSVKWPSRTAGSAKDRSLSSNQNSPSPTPSGCSTPPTVASERVEGVPLPGKGISEKKAEERKAEERKKTQVLECQRKIDEHTGKLKENKALEEKEQAMITRLTNQLTDCVSEIGEHEQSMMRVQQQLALLQKQLEVSCT